MRTDRISIRKRPGKHIDVQQRVILCLNPTYKVFREIDLLPTFEDKKQYVGEHDADQI
jgi:hypothetical protein